MSDNMDSAGSPTMSSAEIADLLGAPHDDVKGAMERLANEALIRITMLAGAGAVAYAVNERDSLIVVADLAPEASGDLDDYWQARGNEDGWRYTTAALDLDPQQVAAEAAALALEAQWQALRQERDRRLAECDWTMLADAPLLPGKVEEWLSYRQALRDMPATTADPADPQWPEVPAA